MSSPLEQPVFIETAPHEDGLRYMTLDEHLHLRLLAIRSSEAQADHLPNQDYAQFSYHQAHRGQGSLAFCVCDGVSSAYKGDFAARYLGRQLHFWLCTLPTLSECNPSALHTRLETLLQRWAGDSHALLQSEAIPDDLSVLMHETLHEQYENHGSQAIFLCGRLDYRYTQGWPSGHALFYWMGNIAAHLALTSGKNIAIGDTSDRCRWSTRHGLHGPLSSQMLHFSMLKQMLIYTDGLHTLSPRLAALDNDALMQSIETLLARPDSDDMTMLDLQWQS